jgi:hypothetical protein
MKEKAVFGVPVTVHNPLENVYLVFSCYGHDGEMRLPNGRFSITRINPRTGHQDALGTVDGGRCPFKLPYGEWVLLSRRA